MTVIFTSIPKFLDFFPIMLKRFNINVFYLFSNYNSHDNNKNFIWINKLEKHKIYPLPADTIKKYVYPYFKKGLSDMYREITNKLLSNKLIKKLPKFFDKNNNIEKKINIEFYSHTSSYDKIIDSVETWLIYLFKKY